MPLLKLQTSAEVADEKDVLAALSKAVAETTGKLVEMDIVQV